MKSELPKKKENPKKSPSKIKWGKETVTPKKAWKKNVTSKKELKPRSTKMSKKQKLIKKDNFYRMQGMTMGFFLWVLTSNDEFKIHSSFNTLMEYFTMLNVKDNLLFAFISKAIDNGDIDRAHIDTLMLALINNDQDQITIGWLTHNFKIMDSASKN